MAVFRAEQGKRRRNNLGMATSVVGEADQFTKLPDELAVAILSRSASTLNEAARCSSLMGKRWRHVWKLIDGGVLDFDKSDDDITPEAQQQFVSRVDQAIGLVQQSTSSSRLDGLRIGFKLLKMEEAGWRWIQFGLEERVKRLALLSYMPRSCFTGHFGIPVPLLTPAFLCKQDLSRLEVVEFRDLSKIPRGTMDHIFSNCPSLQQLSLNNCSFQEDDTVIRVCCPNNSKLQRLTFHFTSMHHCVSRVEILSAPSLHSLEVGSPGRDMPWFEFGDDIAQLQELRFCDRGECGRKRRHYFPWSQSQFNMFAPRLQLLKYDLATFNFDPRTAPPPEWLLFEKLTVLDLTIYIYPIKSTMLESTAVLRAAPILRQLSISFVHAPNLGWRNNDGAEELPTWKHHSLQVLQLHGVHPSNSKRFVDPRKPIMQLAACIIMNSPSLNQVLIDTGNVTSNISREPQQIDALIAEARMELESRLHYSHTVTSQIHFTYR